MITIRDEIAADVPAREALLDRCLGERRTAKSSERLREGRLPAEGLALTAERDGIVVATVRLWHVEAGGKAALLLGPLAVAPELQGEGLGRAMMREAIWRAACRGHGAVLLVGDAAYYERFGFSGDLARDLAMPGPVERGALPRPRTARRRAGGRERRSRRHRPSDRGLAGR